MARICDYCGKQTRFGNRVTIRGKAKYLGGVGTKVTGCERRTFQPNLQRVRALVNGKIVRARVCTRCLKAGRVQKPMVRTIPAASS